MFPSYPSYYWKCEVLLTANLTAKCFPTEGFLSGCKLLDVAFTDMHRQSPSYYSLTSPFRRYFICNFECFREWCALKFAASFKDVYFKDWEEETVEVWYLLFEFYWFSFSSSLLFYGLCSLVLICSKLHLKIKHRRYPLWHNQKWPFHGWNIFIFLFFFKSFSSLQQLMVHKIKCLLRDIPTHK